MSIRITGLLARQPGFAAVSSQSQSRAVASPLLFQGMDGDRDKLDRDEFRRIIDRASEAARVQDAQFNQAVPDEKDQLSPEEQYQTALGHLSDKIQGIDGMTKKLLLEAFIEEVLKTGVNEIDQWGTFVPQWTAHYRVEGALGRGIDQLAQDGWLTPVTNFRCLTPQAWRYIQEIYQSH